MKATRGSVLMNGRKICAYLMLVLTMHLALLGCVQKKVALEISDKPFFSTNRTNLVAGLNIIKDKRPETETVDDEKYEKPHSVSINERLYKDLKMSGLFTDVLYEKFDRDKVDVLLNPYVDHLSYEEKLTGWTPLAFLLALTSIPGLLYLAVGGPVGEHYAEASIGLEMTSLEGKILASGSGQKVLTLTANVHNETTDGRGKFEGKALAEATYDTIFSLSEKIKGIDLPVAKLAKPAICGSDKDCKGDRICVEGKCVSPDVEKKMQGAKLMD